MALTDSTSTMFDEFNKLSPQIDKNDSSPIKYSNASENCDFDEDLSLEATRRKRFRIDGDSKRILELNTSDMTVINRLEELYPRLQQLSQDAVVKQLEESTDLETTAAALKHIDGMMRDIIDEIFDSNVSEMCAPSGSMFDPFNGEFRFEHIIEVVSKKYSENIARENAKISRRMKAHTDKYIKKNVKKH